MNLHRTVRAGMGVALAASSLAVISLVSPLSTTAASASTNCSPTALPKSGKVDITYWEGMSAANETLMKKLVAQFNSSQSKVHVTEVNQPDYVTTWNDYLNSLRTSGTELTLVRVVTAEVPTVGS